MPEPNETYNKIQNIRVRNLEQQVHLMRAELQRIREGLLPQRDIIRLTSLADKLKELNDVLKDLRNQYNREKSKQYEKEYFATTADHNAYTEEKFEYVPSTKKIFNDASNSAKHDNPNENKTIGVVDQNTIQNNTENSANNNTENLNNESLATCKDLINEMKPPGSILGNHIIKLRDFRTDPELRRQRLEKKEKEKLEKLRAKNEANLNENHQILTTTNFKEATNSSVAQTNYKNLLTNVNIENINDNQYRNEIFRCSIADDTHCNDANLPAELILINKNLREVVYDIVHDIDPNTVALTVVLETDQLYHISVSTTSSGEFLACFFSTEYAIQEAKIQNLFKEFLTLFVVNAENSMAQKDRILGHSFEFIKLDDD